MSFLNRRRSFAPTHHPSPAPPLPFPRPVENICNSSSSTMPSTNGKTSGPTRIIRRVSSLFRKKRPPALAPIPNVQPESQRWQTVNDDQSVAESDMSEDDIRRPSGLGRAVSISSNRSLPPSPFTAIDEESPFHVAAVVGHERLRAMSSPNLLRSLSTKAKGRIGRRSSLVRFAQVPASALFSRIPSEILEVILSCYTRSSVASMATISRKFCSAVRATLYQKVDLPTLSPAQIEDLITLLSSRRDLADLVQTFECDIWPSFFLSRPNIPGPHSLSVSAKLTATFTIAFQNMHHLTSLVLPSFDDTFLRYHSAFGLKNVTFLSRTMSATETTRLFRWLDGQTNITHLSFPNLIEYQDTHLITATTDTHKSGRNTANTLIDSLNINGAFLAPSPNISPSSSPMSFTFPFVTTPTTPKSPFGSSTLLPSLKQLHATPSILISLASGATATPRPLSSVTLSINTTLYTGLRPGALMTSLEGITRLELVFGPAVDRRTVGKVLSAAGAALTNGNGNGKALQHLHISLADSGTGAEQALYKIISSVLPRYQGLLTLSLSFTSGGDIPYSPTSASPPSLIPALSEHDYTQITSWLKYCPSLQTITLLSGARWQAAVRTKNSTRD